jgi:plastocyanin
MVSKMKTVKFFITLTILLLLGELNFAQTFHYEVVGNNYFFQAELTIQVGDTVRWINGVDGGGVHNIVADDSSFTSGPPSFPWVYDHVFSTAGVFPYQCSEHGASGMTVLLLLNPQHMLQMINYL